MVCLKMQKLSKSLNKPKFPIYFLYFIMKNKEYFEIDSFIPPFTWNCKKYNQGSKGTIDGN